MYRNMYTCSALAIKFVKNANLRSQVESLNSTVKVAYNI